jgi:hypothetical protein
MTLVPGPVPWLRRQAVANIDILSRSRCTFESKAPERPGALLYGRPVRLSANDVEPHEHAAAISNGVNVKTERPPNPFSTKVLMLCKGCVAREFSAPLWEDC